MNQEGYSMVKDIVAVDIDDVLYNTSILIMERIPTYLRSIGIEPKIRKVSYNIAEMFGITKEQVKSVWGKAVPLNDKEYLNYDAIAALKQLQEKYGVKYHIVSARYMDDSLKKTKEKTAALLEDTGLNIEEIHIGVRNKAKFCEEKGYVTLLDDYVRNIEQFKGRVIKPILVSTPNVFHNKDVVGDYFYTLTNWSELDSVYRKVKNIA